MGFFSGRATFVRLQINGASPGIFGPKHLEALSERKIGHQRTRTKDGIDFGWIAGDHILDLDFDFAKNVVVDALHFALRVDTEKLPPDLLRAYAKVDLKAFADDNPSGRPSVRQKRDARESARERLEHEAKDGRYIRRKMYPVLWDANTNEVLIGTRSPSVIDRVGRLFGETFGVGLTPLDAGQLIYHRSASNGRHSKRNEPTPSVFVEGFDRTEVAWIRDFSSHNYLGNEFLLWLWFTLETSGDTLVLTDKSTATVMLARNLLLECPRHVSGSETIRSEAPPALPEARRAIQAGKLPRRAGITVIRHDQQMEFSLQPERIAIEGAKLPTLEAKEERSRFEERLGQLRHLIETTDLLLETFARQRLGVDWPKELERMQRWLRHDGRGRKAS